MNWQKIKESGIAVRDAVWEALKIAGEKINLGYQWLFRTATEDGVSRKTVFLTYSWIGVVLFFTSFILAGHNPFVTLVPFSLYEVANRDPRSEITIYGSDGERNVFPVRRKVLWEGDEFRHKTLTLIGEIGESSYFDKTVESGKGEHYKNLKRLPEIQYAVKSVWKRGNGLILDLRKSTLQEIVSGMKFRIDYTYAQQMSEEQKQREIVRKKMALLDSTFLALEKTIFENFQDVQSVEYKLDGLSEAIPGMEYSLDSQHKRN
ncbi:N-acetylmuramoyl-L-alanine amidase [Leptospira ellisii]|uniref:N-acetylmuramoyl-L-alanine amidase n=1 Tax=Leptospira ellisii TaxID=2023197 RepID=A0A2N0B5S6_9LEPT|nr:N-acetylmuramoyl-L-alanine amidase [Leptospira ellisii]MDV6235977.1 N-acetylmuramoyl-L-alanine amidase [Leptospira ellisii]PJZ91866.1 N-acetylmuramoyl-L-alanine amidase [Leptospira ellisii]PKA05160.1 N-acetylmuramoyl-L-alanine amidase [Leptospira ellisii]